jgi:hypothetical protein
MSGFIGSVSFVYDKLAFGVARAVCPASGKPLAGNAIRGTGAFHIRSPGRSAGYVITHGDRRATTAPPSAVAARHHCNFLQTGSGAGRMGRHGSRAAQTLRLRYT